MTLKGLFNLALELSIKKTTQLKNIETKNLDDDASYANAINTKLQPENETDPIIKNIFIILNHCVTAQITPPTTFKLFQAISSIATPEFTPEFTPDDNSEYQELYGKFKDDALAFVNERKAAHKNSVITTKQSASSPAVIAPPTAATSQARPNFKDDLKNALLKRTQPSQITTAPLTINDELKKALLKRSQPNSITATSSNIDDLKNASLKKSQPNSAATPTSSHADELKNATTPPNTGNLKKPILTPAYLTPKISPPLADKKPSPIADRNASDAIELLNKQLEIEKQKSRMLEEKLADRLKKLDAAESKLYDQHKVLLLFHDNLKEQEKAHRKTAAELELLQKTAENTFLYNPNTDGDIQANELKSKLQPYIHYLAQDKYYDLIYNMACDAIADNAMMKNYLGYFYKEYKDANQNILFHPETKSVDSKNETSEFKDKLWAELFARYQDALRPDATGSQFTPEERANHKLCANFFAVTLGRIGSLKNKSALSQLAAQPFTAFVQRNKTKFSKEIEKACTLLLYAYMEKNTLPISKDTMTLFMAAPPSANTEDGIATSLSSITQSLTSKVMWAFGK
jgi:hypothetical protein